MTSSIPITRHSVNLRSEVERTLRTVFKRCVTCPEDVNPTCPPCSKSEICSLVPSDCNACARMVFVDNPNPLPSSSGPNVPAIAGGVVGGIAFVAIVVFLLWRFYIRKKRAQQELEAEEWEGDDIAAQKTTQSFQAMHQDAASTRTRGSLTGSFISRMSNVIHIAYIPGVTNRNGNDNSPVPPIPAARRDMPRSPLANEDGALFFRPGDLRDSTYSGTSDFTDRRDTQYTRASITPSLARSSIASAIYTNNVDPMPAQQVVRAAPRMVSVKTASSHSPSSETGSASGSAPTTSGSDTAQFAANTPAGKGKPVQIMMPGQSERSATGSVKSNASYGKAQQITVAGGKGKGRFPISREGSASSSKHAPSVSSPLAEGGPPTSPERLKDRSPTVLSPINASPASQPAESPFFDASEAPPAPSPAAPAAPRPNPYASMTSSVVRSREDRVRGGGRGPGALSAVIEEATKRASEVQSIAGKRDSSPFTDAHRTE